MVGLAGQDPGFCVSPVLFGIYDLIFSTFFGSALRKFVKSGGCCGWKQLRVFNLLDGSLQYPSQHPPSLSRMNFEIEIFNA